MSDYLDIEWLRQRVAELEEENERLRFDIESLILQCTLLTSDYKESETENDRLRDELDNEREAALFWQAKARGQ